MRSLFKPLGLTVCLQKQRRAVIPAAITLLLACATVANAQLIRTELARGEWPLPAFPLAPQQIREVMVRIPPHGVGPWHYHPGPATITVGSSEAQYQDHTGDFTLMQDEPGCPEETYHPGDVAVEPVGVGDAHHVHRPSNPSDNWTIVYITFTLPPGTDMDLIPLEPQFCGK